MSRIKNIKFITHNSLLVTLFSLLLVPMVVFAAPQDFKSLIYIFLDIIDKFIPLVYGLVFLYFFWGIGKYIFSSGSEDKRNDAKNIMTWGLIAIFVLTSFYAILKLVGGAFLPNLRQYDVEQPTRREMDDGSYRQLIDPRTMQPYPGIDST